MDDDWPACVSRAGQATKRARVAASAAATAAPSSTRLYQSPGNGWLGAGSGGAEFAPPSSAGAPQSAGTACEPSCSAFTAQWRSYEGGGAGVVPSTSRLKSIALPLPGRKRSLRGLTPRVNSSATCRAVRRRSLPIRKPVPAQETFG